MWYFLCLKICYFSLVFELCSQLLILEKSIYTEFHQIPPKCEVWCNARWGKIKETRVHSWSIFANIRLCVSLISPLLHEKATGATSFMSRSGFIILSGYQLSWRFVQFACQVPFVYFTQKEIQHFFVRMSPVQLHGIVAGKEFQIDSKTKFVLNWEDSKSMYSALPVWIVSNPSHQNWCKFTHVESVMRLKGAIQGGYILCLRK